MSDICLCIDGVRGEGRRGRLVGISKDGWGRGVLLAGLYYNGYFGILGVEGGGCRLCCAVLRMSVMSGMKSVVVDWRMMVVCVCVGRAKYVCMCVRRGYIRGM